MSEVTVTKPVDEVFLAIMERAGITEEDLRIAELTRQYYEEQTAAVADELEHGSQEEYENYKSGYQKAWANFEENLRNPYVAAYLPDYYRGPLRKYVPIKNRPGASYTHQLQRDSWERVKAASDDPESEVSIEILNRVIELEEQVEKAKRALRVIESDGNDIESDLEFADMQVPFDRGYESYFLDSHVERRQRGNNTVGMEQGLGAMARSAIRMYDIKDGVAMRARLAGNHFDKNNNISSADTWSIGSYIPFAPQHQERAMELMRSLAKKQHDRANEQARRKNVKVAREILSRAGVRIPKTA
jgi:hypothetical protein